MTQEATKNPSPTATNVERRIEIRRRIAELKPQFEAILQSCHDARCQIPEIEARRQRLELDLNHANGIRQGPALYDKNRFEKALDEAKTLLANAEQKREEINAEITKLNNELAASYGEASIDEILTHQAEIENTEAEIERLSGLIASQQKIIQSATMISSPLGQMRLEREDLLAEIAEGKDEQSRLDELNASILETENQQTEAYRQADNAKMTIRGLQRKVDLEKTRLEELEARTEDFMNDLVLSEANRLHQDYEVIVQEFRDVFSRLVVLDRLAPNNPSFLGLNWNEVNIPAFRLKSIVEPPKSGAGEVLFAANDVFMRDVLEETKNSELERFRNLGVAI